LLARRLRFLGRFLRSFSSLRISPAGSHFAHARNPAQFQPLTHLSALINSIVIPSEADLFVHE